MANISSNACLNAQLNDVIINMENVPLSDDTGRSPGKSIDTTSNMGNYNSVPLSVEETGHSSVRPIEFAGEEALSSELREVQVEMTGASGNTIVGRREFIINSSIRTHLKFFWKKIKCILAGAVACASIGAVLGAAAVFAGDKEKDINVFNILKTDMEPACFIEMVINTMFEIGTLFYAATKTEKDQVLWGAGIGAVIGGILGGYYGTKENEPIEALTIAGKKVFYFIDKIRLHMYKFIKARKAPVKAEQCPKSD